MIGGIPITLLDTAGLRESVDLVEQIGVERSMAAARQADIVLMVLDAQAGWTPGDAEIAAQMFGGGSGPGSPEVGEGTGWGSGGDAGEEGGGRRGMPALLVVNKTDLAREQGQQPGQQEPQQQNGSTPAAAGADASSAARQLGVPPAVGSRFAAVVSTSAATREGLQDLQQAVLSLAGAPQVSSRNNAGWACAGGSARRHQQQ